MVYRLHQGSRRDGNLWWALGVKDEEEEEEAEEEEAEQWTGEHCASNGGRHPHSAGILTMANHRPRRA